MKYQIIGGKYVFDGNLGTEFIVYRKVISDRDEALKNLAFVHKSGGFDFVSLTPLY